MSEINEKELEQVNGGKRGDEEAQPFAWPFRDQRPYLKNTYARQYAKELTDEEKKEFRQIENQEEREAYLFMHNFEL